MKPSNDAMFIAAAILAASRDENTRAMVGTYLELRLAVDDADKKIHEDKMRAEVAEDILAGRLISIRDLGLSMRSMNILLRARIDSVEHLDMVPDEELMKLRNFGKQSLHEVRNKRQGKPFIYTPLGAIPPKVHWDEKSWGANTPCGKKDAFSRVFLTTNRPDVTCKSCLHLLAKKDGAR